LLELNIQNLDDTTYASATAQQDPQYP